MLWKRAPAWLPVIVPRESSAAALLSQALSLHGFTLHRLQGRGKVDTTKFLLQECCGGEGSSRGCGCMGPIAVQA